MNLRVPRLNKWALTGLGVVVVLGGVVAFLLGPGGAALVSKLAEGRSVWRVGELHLEGVAGASLGDLRIERATLRDDQGVWLEAEDLAIDWSPLALLTGDVVVEAVAADRVTMLRRPVLSAPSPEGGGGLDVRLGALRIDRAEFREAAFGEAAAFVINGALALSSEKGILTAALDADRLDQSGDRLAIAYDRAGAPVLDAELRSERGGFFAAALGADNEAVLATINAETLGEGSGELDLFARVGEATLARGELSWRDGDWQSEIEANLAAAPALTPLAERLGGPLAIEAGGALPAEDAPGTVRAQLRSNALAAEASGPIGSNFFPVGELKVAARSPKLETLIGTVATGPGLFDGVVTFGENLNAAGRVELGIETGGVAARWAGPIRVAMTDGAVQFDTQGEVGAVSGQGVLADLIRQAKGEVAGRWMRMEERLELEAARLEGPNALATADGTFSAEKAMLYGRWRVKKLGVLTEEIAGSASGTWGAARNSPDEPLRIMAQGEAQTFSSELPGVNDLVGPSPNLAASLVTIPGGVRIESARVASPQFRLGARGRVANDRIDLALEASARGPVDVAEATLTGVVDATGRISGRVANPTLVAQASMGAIQAAGVTIERPVLEARLAPSSTGRTGTVSLAGRVFGEPATASAEVRATDQAFALENLVVQAAGLTGRGQLVLADAGPSLDLAIAGDLRAPAVEAFGSLRGTVAVRPAPAGQDALLVEAAAQVDDARLGRYTFDAVRARAQGTTENLAFSSEVLGATAGVEIRLDAQGSVRQQNAATIVEVTGDGAVNGDAFSLTEPAIVRFDGDGLSANAELAVGAGTADIAFTQNGRTLDVAASLDDAPLRPFAILLGERAQGSATGTIRASSAPGGLEGEAALQLVDALLPARMREPLTLVAEARLQPNLLLVEGVATSDTGLRAQVDARVPVTTSAEPLQIALAGEGAAQWSVNGPAAPLFALVGGLDQRVTGDLDGQGELRFATGSLSGSGALTLADGSIEDRLTGVSLRDVDAEIAFGEAGAQLVNFSARDPEGGRLTATGSADGLREGRVELVARDMVLVNRQDAAARASGPLTLTWDAEGALLTGDLTLEEANIEPPQDVAGDIPQLDVVEINEPAALARARADDEAEEGLGIPVRLDVALNAPGRVFVRGRGLDSEWALDLRVQGTADNPQLFGEARLIRGVFDLAGRPFDVERGVVEFAGDITDARLSAEAERETQDLTATVELAGTVSSPEIELSSDPALPEEEVLPQVLFGRSVQDLSAVEAAQLAAGLAALTGQSAFNVAGVARDLVGLDRLDVRETDEGLRIAGGKYLTRDVYLEVARTGVGEAATQLEWRVRPQFYVISAFNPNGDRRISVRWRNEY